jgi:hypothetical protein
MFVRDLAFFTPPLAYLPHSEGNSLILMFEEVQLARLVQREHRVNQTAFAPLHFPQVVEICYSNGAGFLRENV